MDTFGVIVVMAVICLIVWKVVSHGKSATQRAGSAQREIGGASPAREAIRRGPPTPGLDWLRDRWADAEREQASELQRA